MPVFNIVILSIVFFIIAFLSRLAGKGGGNFYVLALVLAGFNIHNGVPISQLTLFLSSLLAVVIFHKKKTLIWSLALLIVPVAVLGAFFGGFYANAIDENVLRRSFAVLLFLSGSLMLIFMKRKPYKKQAKESIFYLNFTFMDMIYPINIPLMISASFISGFLASLVGLGGGIIMLPVLVFIFRVPMKAVVGITPLLVLGVSLFGFLGHIIHTKIDYSIASYFIISAIIGAYFGSHAVVKVNEKVLKLVFAISALSSAVIMWIKAS